MWIDGMSVRLWGFQLMCGMTLGQATSWKALGGGYARQRKTSARRYNLARR